MKSLGQEGVPSPHLFWNGSCCCCWFFFWVTLVFRKWSFHWWKPEQQPRQTGPEIPSGEGRAQRKLLNYQQERKLLRALESMIPPHTSKLRFSSSLWCHTVLHTQHTSAVGTQRSLLFNKSHPLKCHSKQLPFSWPSLSISPSTPRAQGGTNSLWVPSEFGDVFCVWFRSNKSLPGAHTILCNFFFYTPNTF